MQQIICNIAIDDCNPLKGYRILGEKPEKWLRELNERYGCKFTLFIPSNFHNQAKLSENKEWVKELNSIPFLELAAHGHFHDTSDRLKFGECEMAEPNPLIAGIINDMLGEWYDCLGTYPVGFRPPGWLCSENVKNTLEVCFKYVAIHYEHNQGMKWNCKTFFGHDGIHQENISIHNDNMIMFQSHIYGNHNHNVWNEPNFEQLCLSLDHLTQNYDCIFKTLKECL
jgi:hypothetical protein